VPEAIKNLFCETWRKTLIAARMTHQFSDEALEKATVSEETRTIKACVDRLEGAIREHVEQRRVEADTLRTLTLRLAETCAASENAHSRLYEKLFDCRIAAETLQHRLLELGRDIEHTHVELHSLRRDLPLHLAYPPALSEASTRAPRSHQSKPAKKRRSRR
jgi:hypothetical protein